MLPRLLQEVSVEPSLFGIHLASEEGDGLVALANETNGGQLLKGDLLWKLLW